MLVGDDRIKEFCRDGYEFARQRGIPRLGCFGEHHWFGMTEGCTVADMLTLPSRLTDAGLGDYWDDIDCITRNQLVEQQFTDAKLVAAARRGDNSKNPNLTWLLKLREEASPYGQVCTENVAERVVGCWANFCGPQAIPYPYITNCCPPNCSHALYAVWEAALRERDGHATVNLLLNRRSPSVEVESHLPHAGKVVIPNRTGRAIAVRMPVGVMRDAVQVGRAVRGRETMADGSESRPYHCRLAGFWYSHRSRKARRSRSSFRSPPTPTRTPCHLPVRLMSRFAGTRVSTSRRARTTPR